MTKKSKFEIRKPPPGVSQAQESITFERLEEYPYKSVALASTRANLTGLWRYWRPYFETKRAPCDAHCPVGNRIVVYIQTLLDGEWREAATILRSENPLPAITGRLCQALPSSEPALQTEAAVALGETPLIVALSRSGETSERSPPAYMPA